MIDAQRFRVNAENVVYETIDDAGVIVNMNSGIYYSVVGPGAEIWALIYDGTSTLLIVRALEGRYSAPREDLEAGAAHEAYKLRFEAPVLERYSDMEDLLLLDPIHDEQAQ